MERGFTPKEFNALKFRSPASGRIWDFKYLLNKFNQRSISEVFDDDNNLINYYGMLQSQYGDIDLFVQLQIESESLWTNSPKVALLGGFPLHITCNGDILNPFKSGGIDYKQPEGNQIVLITLNSEIGVEFTLKDINKTSRKKIYNYIISLVEFDLHKKFKNWLINPVEV